MSLTSSQKIDQMIAGLDDWRGPMLETVRRIILGANPGIVEDWKWMGSPAWSHSGLIAVGNPHKGKVKLTFAYGAHLPDPAGLFNGKDTGNTRRSIDIVENAPPDEAALAGLVRQAIKYNLTHLKKNAPAKKD